MNKLKVLDLFSGIGGFSLGLERTGGFETVAFCEIEEFQQKVLKKHWPEIPCYPNVKELPYEEDIIKNAEMVTAGFPCQDISYAGDGAGLSGERSGLWWFVRRTIRLVRPRVALLENVAALLNRGMGTVLGSLASIGYDTEWNSIPLALTGAPHRRDRLCIISYPQGERCSEAWGVRYKQQTEWLSRCREANFPANAWQERSKGFKPQAISGFGSFSWCQNVRSVEDLRDRPDIPPPLFRGGRDGIPNWVGRIEGAGNAYSPIAVEVTGRAFLSAQAILEAEKQRRTA